MDVTASHCFCAGPGSCCVPPGWVAWCVGVKPGVPALLTLPRSHWGVGGSPWSLLGSLGSDRGHAWRCLLDCPALPSTQGSCREGVELRGSPSPRVQPGPPQTLALWLTGVGPILQCLGHSTSWVMPAWCPARVTNACPRVTVPTARLPGSLQPGWLGPVLLRAWCVQLVSFILCLGNYTPGALRVCVGE